jgi:hypothetical protein
MRQTWGSSSFRALRWLGNLGVLGAAMLALAAGAEAKDVPGSVTSVAGWRLAAYTHESTGKFSHCAISAPYRSGISMLFAVSDNFSWRVGWVHEGWHLQIGQSVEIELYFDGSGPYRVTAKATTNRLVLAELASTAAIFDAFRKGYVLTVRALGNRYAFNLDGTYAALTEVVDCTRRYANAPSTTPPPMTGAKLPSPRPALEVTAEQRLEATTVVANILGQGELSNFKILTAKERKELDDKGSLESWHVIWRADDVIGMLRIVPKGLGASSNELATSMLADDARACKGSFASGSTPDEGGRNAVRLFTACNDKAGSFETRYTVVPLDDGMQYVFGTIGKSRDGERPEAASKADQLLRTAVYQVLRK